MLDFIDEIRHGPADDAGERSSGARAAHRLVQDLPAPSRARSRRDGRALWHQTRTVPDRHERLVRSKCGSRAIDMVVTETARREEG